MNSQSAEPLQNNRLNALLDQLYGLHPKLIDLSLDRVERFLKELGNPHLNLPPIIHVAGTNGKGSTIAALRAILEEHGKTCHLATSPHLVRINERIVIAGKEIDDETLADLIEECISKNMGQDITFFEMIICVTFLAFSRTKADFCLIETGLGGRLDATNVIPNPATTIITTISKDHQDFLGNSLSKIAAEKAGIMKAGTPCVLGRQTNEAIDEGVIDTISSKALSTDVTLHQFEADWRVEPMQDHFCYQDEEVRYELANPALIGSHQIYNTGSAIAACRVIPNFELDAEKLSTAMGQMHWPGRLQKLDHKGFDGITGTDWQVWLDGGHNDSAGQVLAQQIDEWTAHDDTKKVHIILGMMTRKNPVDFIEPFVSKIASITCVPIDGEENSYSSHDLYKIIEPVSNAPVLSAETVQEAIDGILNQFPQRGIILITGSLYLVGQVLAEYDLP